MLPSTKKKLIIIAAAAWIALGIFFRLGGEWITAPDNVYLRPVLIPLSLVHSLGTFALILVGVSAFVMLRLRKHFSRLMWWVFVLAGAAALYFVYAIFIAGAEFR